MFQVRHFKVIVEDISKGSKEPVVVDAGGAVGEAGEEIGVKEVGGAAS